MALAEKGVDYETVEIDLRAIPDWYRQISPNQKVPLLDHGGRLIWESAVLEEYVQEAFPGPSLMPPHPADRAMARILMDAAGPFVTAFYRALMEGDTEKLGPALDTLEKHARPGPYLLGTQLTLADLHVYPWFERWPVLEHYRGLTWDDKRYPRLTLWREAMAARAAVRADAQSPEFYIQQYRDYAERARAAR